MEDQLEKDAEVGGLVVEIALGCSQFGIGVDNGEFKLFFRGIQVDKKVVDLVQDLLNSGIRRGRFC